MSKLSASASLNILDALGKRDEKLGLKSSNEFKTFKNIATQMLDFKLFQKRR